LGDVIVKCNISTTFASSLFTKIDIFVVDLVHYNQLQQPTSAFRKR